MREAILPDAPEAQGIRAEGIRCADLDEKRQEDFFDGRGHARDLRKA